MDFSLDFGGFGGTDFGGGYDFSSLWGGDRGFSLGDFASQFKADNFDPGQFARFNPGETAPLSGFFYGDDNAPGTSMPPAWMGGDRGGGDALPAWMRGGQSGQDSDWLSMLAKTGKTALPFASIGATGLGLANQFANMAEAKKQRALQERAQALQERAVTPLTTFGEGALRNAATGKLPPAEQSKIDLWKQGAKQQARDYLARSGQGDSSTMVQWEQMIDRQAEAMASDVLRQMERGGVAALAGAAGGANSLATGASREAGGIDALIQQANQLLARLAGGAS